MKGRVSLTSGVNAATCLIVLLLVLVATLVLSLGSSEWVPVLVVGIWLTTTATVGALIAANRPGNAVGTLMVAGPVVIALGLFSEAYASYIYELGHPDLPLGPAAAWLTLWLTIPGFALFIHLLLRFPTGHLPSPRWIWASRLTSASLTATVIGFALRPGSVDNVPGVANPLGSVAPSWISQAGLAVGDTLLPIAGLAAVVSLFLRFRKAGTTERQQMKWFVLSVAVFPVLFALSQVSWIDDDGGEDYLGFFLVMTALLFVPVSMGIAILKHRLYDIDVVVNRALVYVALTAVLATAYLGVVVLLQGLLKPITPESDFAVAGSTLVVAALFRPIKERVQGFIDRRFYRRKYDAAETLGAFAGRLRDQVDLEALRNELIGAVSTTMQPAHASLWLREWVSR